MPTLAGSLATTARRVPDRPAIKFQDVELSYRELDRRVDQVATELRRLGLAKGDRLVLMAGNSDLFVVAIMAALRIGAIVAPVNPRSAPPELDYFLTDTAASFFLFAPDVADTVRRWRSLPDRYEDAVVRSLGPIEATPDSDDEPFEDLLAAAYAQEWAPFEAEVREDDDALIIYTSGTTGRPKGVLFDHHRVVWVGVNTSMGIGTIEGERMLHVAPLYHSATLNMLLLHGMMIGATQVILPAFDPETVLATIERERVTLLFGVPTMYTFMLRSPSIGSRDLSSLRTCFYGAAPMPSVVASALLERLPNARLVQACGQTEGGPGGIALTPEEIAIRPEASGRYAMPNTEVRVVDPLGNDVAPGGIGEMIVRGETTMKCYWGRPDATADTVRDGWVHSGDLALFDEDGFITIVDRMKDMIISGGRNIYSAEVENALAGHPAVGEIAIVGRPCEEYGETVVAIVNPREGATVTLEELREFGADLIADYKLPRDLVFAEIPRNPSGKILKHKLRAQFKDQATRVPEADAEPTSQGDLNVQS